MKKHEKRYHEIVGNKVVSVYIQECYLLKTTHYEDKYKFIDTCYYENIGACVSNSKRVNNDWWNGDKIGNRLYNVSTGNGHTFITIVALLESHIDLFIKEYGYYCCMIDGTNDKRIITYFKAVRHYAKKKSLSLTTVATDDGLLCYFE